ncbi:FtsK/SpoIIIE domain-containing protein [Singulisphaera sp. PoT]|uniref:FtsK/SpoIIIE domain-containing protein n=1 Tax=Singulisphaera sp. PoT TaxID=3411797 RepID=UPI003BF57042
MSELLRPSPPESEPKAGDDPASETFPVPKILEPRGDLIERGRRLHGELLVLVSERAAAEASCEKARAAGATLADQEYERSRPALIEKYRRIQDEDRRADETRRRAIIDSAASGEADAKAEFARASRKIAADFEGLRERAKLQLNKDNQKIASEFASGERNAKTKHAEAMKPIEEVTKLLLSQRARLDAVHADYQKFGLKEPSTKPTVKRESARPGDPIAELFERFSRDAAPLKLVEELFIPRALKGNRWIWLFVVLFGIVIVPLIQMQGFAAGAGTAAAIAGVGGFLLRKQLYVLASNQVSQLFDPLFQSTIDAEAELGFLRAGVAEQTKAERAAVAGRRDSETTQAKQRHDQAVVLGEAQRDERLRDINEKYGKRMIEIQNRQYSESREAIEAYEQRKVEVQNRFDTNLRQLEERHGDLKDKIGSRYQAAWNDMAGRWREGIARVRTELDEIARELDEFAPAWEAFSRPDRPTPRQLPPALRFGKFAIDMAGLPGGLPADPRLMEGIPARFDFEALRPFPERANLLIESSGEGRGAALTFLQATMFRLLTSLPPGLVRFTIIDPIGIGRGFGAFMHLADYDEALVTNQVWTEPQQIEERLAELSAHMERVTQRYLRNEYATLNDYNAVAGEVAEPYRVLVVADFPAKFDDKAAQRLADIMAGGIPCGVLTLIHVDLDRPLPPDFTLDRLRPNASRLSWRDGRLVWDDPEFGRYPLTLEAPPAAEAATRLIQQAGALARTAKRVEVPFDFIAPADDALWSLDSRSGIDVALGKAGATKRQHLELGHGTSQHVLIAGRTGSGKSTLLHALIVNLALNYSPDDVDLYLIDFKKGVEFKVYATQHLPHASVVAIESEREFGISVLQRLDTAMRERGERFRDAGVQDIQSYRNAPGTPPLPRMLLIVDEFQEFFVEEDRVAQEASLLLDRLVRQGRAFGVHVLLGSQSLGGAYALARTTLGQMAVRVALQCSEADAPMILNEQNPAARLLSRPGEAIYNDANGQPEGNHFFQVVWLSDARREVYLKRLRELTVERKPVSKRETIVFEGDAATDLARNPLLTSRLDAPAWPATPRSSQAWLGDPVAIKDPTSALFRRQGGNHLLIVGQNDEAALGIMTASLISLASQYAPATSETVRLGARFFVLDGTPEDHPRATFLEALAKRLPHAPTFGTGRDVTRILGEVAADVKRRQGHDAGDGPETFLFIHDIPRFRELRRKENDFGFSRDEEETPADHLATILREGPTLGVHLVVWCDNVINLNRIFDHQSLREFDMRALFQMSPTDSSMLLDSPLASRLGPHRAYFASEEQNRLEKFRPYGIPEDEWLKTVEDRLGRREVDPEKSSAQST